MSSNAASAPSGSFGLVSAFVVLVGLAIAGYGLLVASVSPLGGVWIAAIGLSLSLSGAISTGWAGVRLDLSPRRRRRMSMAFGLLAALLLATFVVVNFASFEPFEAGGSSSG